MKKSKLCKAIAMTMALGGMGIGVYAPTAGAVNLPANGVGDVLIFPYYTTRDGWQTTLSFLNTDEKNIVAIKFRFYEGYNSRDVLDFVAILSPGDVFAGVVEENPDGSGPRFRRAPNDTTCTSPQLAFGNTTANPPVPSGAFPLNVAAFSGTSLVNNVDRANADGGPTSVDRLREGYVVAIVMGHFPVNSVTYPTGTVTIPPAAGDTSPRANAMRTLLSAVHSNTGANTEAECQAVANQFAQAAVRPPAGSATFPTAALFGEPINALRGNYTLLNVSRGTSVGGNAVALANFMTVTPLATDVITGTTITNPTVNTPATPVGVAPRFDCTIGFTDQFGAPTGANAAWNPNAAAASCPNLISAQQPYYFLEPSLNDAYPPEVQILDNGVPGFNGVLGSAVGLSYQPWAPSVSALGSTDVDYGFLAVSELLRARTLVNEWSVNPNLGVSSAWVVTHPTKGFFVDRNGFDSPQAAVNTIRFPDLAGAGSPPIVVNGNLPPFANNFRGTTPTSGNGRSCNQVGFRLFNRDEVSASPAAGGVSPSPSPTLPNLALCYETNVIPFDQDNSVFSSVLLPTEIGNLYNAISTVTNADASMLKPFGWMRLDLNTDPANNTTSLAGPGLPAIGFQLRQRVIPGTGFDSYSDISDHSIIR
jgi:hypothetical protein